MLGLVQGNRMELAKGPAFVLALLTRYVMPINRLTACKIAEAYRSAGFMDRRIRKIISGIRMVRNNSNVFIVLRPRKRINGANKSIQLIKRRILRVHCLIYISLIDVGALLLSTFDVQKISSS
jgi:hypothetical protein